MVMDKVLTDGYGTLSSELLFDEHFKNDCHCVWMQVEREIDKNKERQSSSAAAMVPNINFSMGGR